MNKILNNPMFGATQAMLRAVGLRRTEYHKPVIGIGSVWLEGNPCNVHLNQLGSYVKEGVTSNDLTGFQFNTIGISDGISMGTPAMRYSLISREIIADSFDTVLSGFHYDGCVAIPGCDKNIPGSLMGIIRANIPSIMVYGGSIKKGYDKNNNPIDIVSAFQSYGQVVKGEITEEERTDIIDNACPGPGSCGGMYTANTMASAIEAMGMTLPYSSSILAVDKKDECLKVGKFLRNLIINNTTPSDIIRKESLLNAFTLITVLGGSTNAVLHLLAIAKELEIDLSLNDLQKVTDNTPILANMKPSGKYYMEDLNQVGGVPAVMKYLLSNNMIEGDLLTVTGRTIKQNLDYVLEIEVDQKIFNGLDLPIKKNGHIQILKGNLAKNGAVSKITGKEGEYFSGKAIVFDTEEEAIEAVTADKIKKGHVIVLRYQGPCGGPGMPEMLNLTSTLVGTGLINDIALITDGRFSGGSHGFIIGHVSPEAAVGGEIAAVHNNDLIEINISKKEVNLMVQPFIINERMKKFKKKNKKLSGTLSKYSKLFSDASSGCVTI